LVYLIGLLNADGTQEVVEVGTYEEEGFHVDNFWCGNGEERERIEGRIRS
jgi:hypothetical protein